MVDNSQTMPGAQQALLKLESLELCIHDTPILRDICFELHAGKSLGIIGESGSGKSLTALAIMQLLPRGSVVGGDIRFDGKQLDTMDEASLCEIRGSDIGMIFQEPMSALNPVKTIGDQVSESVRLHQRVGRADADAIALKTLEHVGLPNAQFPLSRYPHELSGGQRQRVVIAIAVACQPKLLIADEPTTALDVTTQAGILSLLKDLQREHGLALLLISHDLAVIAEMADDIVVMNKGQVIESGSIASVFDNPQEPYTRTLFEASALSTVQRTTDHAKRHYEPNCLLRVDQLVCEYPKSRTSLFSKREYFRAVDKVSFDIHEGESVGLVGESGCGKSTLARALLGLMALESGSIELAGESVSTSRSVSRSARRRMQVVFQDPYGSFNPRHKVERLVSEPLHLLDNAPDKRKRAMRVDEVLTSVGMQISDKDKYIHEFSGGQRQRIAIARSLIITPDIIILDEAVSALDVSVRAQVLQLLSQLAREHGLAYLFISHDLSVVQRVTDRVMVMRQGQIVEHGDTDDVFSSPQHSYTKELIAAASVRHV